MRQLRGRSAGLAAAFALGTLLLAGCGHKSASGNTPAPAGGTTAPASQPSSPSSSSGGGGYGY